MKAAELKGISDYKHTHLHLFTGKAWKKIYFNSKSLKLHVLQWGAADEFKCSLSFKDEGW